jgi:ABC-type nitrate/sulfonate/bicarbonate transport system substrate-binding protein
LTCLPPLVTLLQNGGSVMRGSAILGALIGTALLLAPGGVQAQQTVVISTVRSVPSASTYYALEKGYFKDLGIDVQVESIDSLSKAMALLATNQIQVAQGGINAGYFNAVGQGLPVVLALESGSTPVYHNFAVRTDLKDAIRTPADLKGRAVAVSGVGSLSHYELASLMESVGMTLADVDVKVLSFPQMLAALSNRAIDVGVLFAPFSDAAYAQKIAVPWIDPEHGYIKVLPMTSLSYMASTQWIAQNGETAQKVFTALLRASRDYCQAYHGAPIRQEFLDVMVRHDLGKDRAQLDKMQWQARSVDGRVNRASIADLQRVYKKEGLMQREPKLDQLIDERIASAAAQSLGPFDLINKASPLKGCR